MNRSRERERGKRVSEGENKREKVENSEKLRGLSVRNRRIQRER